MDPEVRGELTPVESDYLERATDFTYFIPHEKIRTPMDPSRVSIKLIKIKPTHERYAIINIPLSPDTYKIVWGFSMLSKKTQPGARIVFTDENGIGSLTHNDPNFPHQNLMEGLNESRIVVPVATEGVEPNKAHLFAVTPKGLVVVYDFRDIEELMIIEEKEKLEAEFDKYKLEMTSQSMYFKDQLNIIYKGGKNFKKQYRGIAKKYKAKELRQDWWQAMPKPDPVNSKRHLSMLAMQNKYEINRNEKLYGKLLAWDTTASMKAQRKTAKIPETCNHSSQSNG